MAVISKNAVEKELSRRFHLEKRAKDKIQALKNDCFDLQLAVIEDPSKNITICAGRQSGKTYVLGIYLFVAGLLNPNSEVVYISITKPHAISIIWSELLSLDQKFDIGCHISNIHHELTLPNGTKISLGGYSSHEEREKFRGHKYSLAILDECGSAGPYLQYLLQSVLYGTLIAKKGTLVMAGTPSPTTAGFFYDAVTSKDWSHHTWNLTNNSRMEQWRDNPNWKELAQLELAKWQKLIPSIQFRREYIPEWISDTSVLCYQVNPIKNRFDNLPSDQTFTPVMGIDTGFNDKNAIVILMASNQTNEIYQVDSWGESGKTIDYLADKIKLFQKKYNVHLMIIDPANKLAIESMSQRYAISLIKADKEGKRQHMDELNAALYQGTFKMHAGQNDVYDQISVLEWNKTRSAEKAHQECDAADSALYAFTYCFNFLNANRLKPKLSAEQQFFAMQDELLADELKRNTGKKYGRRDGLPANFWKEDKLK